MCIHIKTYAPTCAHIHEHMQYIPPHTCRWIYTQTHACRHTHVHAHISVQTDLYTYECIHTHIQNMPTQSPKHMYTNNTQAYTYMYTQLFLNFWFGAKSSGLLTCPPPTINKKTCRFNTENSSCAEVHNLVCTMDLPAAFYKV